MLDTSIFIYLFITRIIKKSFKNASNTNLISRYISYNIDFEKDLCFLAIDIMSVYVIESSGHTNVLWSAPSATSLLVQC